VASGDDYWCGESESLNLKSYMKDLIQQTIRPIIKKKSQATFISCSLKAAGSGTNIPVSALVVEYLQVAEKKGLAGQS